MSIPRIGGAKAEALSLAVAKDDRAACIGVDPQVFDDPRDAPAMQEAQAVCDRCPILRACQTAALAFSEPFDPDDFRGGTTPKQRAAVRASHAAALRFMREHLTLAELRAYIARMEADNPDYLLLPAIREQRDRRTRRATTVTRYTQSKSKASTPAQRDARALDRSAA